MRGGMGRGCEEHRSIPWVSVAWCRFDSFRLWRTYDRFVWRFDSGSLSPVAFGVRSKTGDCC